MNKYIVKGKIRDLVYYGNKKIIRRGSYQFLPSTEVILTDINNLLRYDKKLWVRGLNKAKLYSTKGIYFKYLNDLRIEELNNPSAKTLEFIRKNELLFFGEDRISEVKEMINFFEEKTYPEKLNQKVDDKFFFSAQTVLRNIQTQISNKQYSKLIDEYINFPLEIRHFIRPKSKQLINKNEFELKHQNYFKKDVCQSILNTNIETIFPAKGKMLIGKCEMDISNISSPKIVKIIFNKR